MDAKRRNVPALFALLALQMNSIAEILIGLALDIAGNVVRIGIVEKTTGAGY